MLPQELREHEQDQGGAAYLPGPLIDVGKESREKVARAERSAEEVDDEFDAPMMPG